MGFGWYQAEALGSLVGGISTALAFGGALWVIKVETRTRRKEQLEREEERRDEERRQARLVFATLGRAEQTDRDPGDGPRSYSEVHVEVFNHSNEPVWDLQVPVKGRESRPLLIERVDPHSHAGNGWLDAPPDWYLMNVGAGCPGSPHWTTLDVIFVDNHGRRWRRSGRAEPVRLLGGSDEPAG
jgi:hypothetical protein